MENHIVFDCLSRLLATKRHDFYLPIPAVNLSIPVEITTNPPNKLRRLEIHPQTTRGIPPTTRHARFIRDNNLTSVCHQYRIFIEIRLLSPTPEAIPFNGLKPLQTGRPRTNAGPTSKTVVIHSGLPESKRSVQPSGEPALLFSCLARKIKATFEVLFPPPRSNSRGRTAR